jgi:hypothetical protein
MVDVQLGEERGAVAPLVGGAHHADLAAEPAVAEQHGELVRTRHDQVGHVEGLRLQPRVVLGVAGSQLVVAHPSSVDEHLVQAVGGGVEPRSGNLPADSHCAPQLVRGTTPGRCRLVLRRPNPDRGPVLGVEQTGLQGDRLRPVAVAAVGAHLHLHADAVPRAERRERPRHEHALLAVEPAAVGVGVGPDPVGQLSGCVGGQLPRQSRFPVPDAQRLVQMLHTQAGGGGHGAVTGRSLPITAAGVSSDIGPPHRGSYRSD